MWNLLGYEVDSNCFVGGISAGILLFLLLAYIIGWWVERQNRRAWAVSPYKDYPEAKYGPFINTLVVDPGSVDAILRDNGIWMTAVEMQVRIAKKYFGIDMADSFNRVLARLAVTHPGKAYLFDIVRYL